MPVPFASQAQAAAFHAAAEGRGTSGIDPKFARQVVRENAGRKTGKLPRRVKGGKTTVRAHTRAGRRVRSHTRR